MCRASDVEAPAADTDVVKPASGRKPKGSGFAFSDIFFYEIFPTLTAANERRLEPSDIMIDHDVASDQYEQFAESWEAEHVRAEKLKVQLAAEQAKEAAEKAAAPSGEASDVEAAEKKGAGEKKKKEKKTPAEPKPRIGRALLPLLGMLQPVSALLFAVDLGLK